MKSVECVINISNSVGTTTTTTTTTETNCPGLRGQGGNKDGPCIFPFKYQGASKTQCADYGNYGNGDWCATEVDAGGEYTKFGFCTCDGTTTTTSTAGE